MSLLTDIGQCAESIWKREASVTRLIRLCKAQLPADAYAELMVEMCGMAADCQKLKSWTAAARDVGELPRRPLEPKAADLDLHPVNRPLSEAEIRALHRANDHTLDREEGVS